MLSKATQPNLICGLLPEVIPGGIIRYADDTILFLENDISVAQNLKWLLCCFEKMSGLRINYHKIDLMVINLPSDQANIFS